MSHSAHDGFSSSQGCAPADVDREHPGAEDQALHVKHSLQQVVRSIYRQVGEINECPRFEPGDAIEISGDVVVDSPEMERTLVELGDGQRVWVDWVLVGPAVRS